MVTVTGRTVSLPSRPFSWGDVRPPMMLMGADGPPLYVEECKEAMGSATVTSFSEPALVSSDAEFDYFCDV